MLALSLSAVVVAAAVCPVSEQTLAGAWANVSGGPFEEMAFEVVDGKQQFNSWLHQRPEIFGGSWRLEDCTIHVRHPTEEALSYELRVERLLGDRLYLREKDGGQGVYRRVKASKVGETTPQNALLCKEMMARLGPLVGDLMLNGHVRKAADSAHERAKIALETCESAPDLASTESCSAERESVKRAADYVDSLKKQRAAMPAALLAPNAVPPLGGPARAAEIMQANQERMKAHWDMITSCRGER